MRCTINYKKRGKPLKEKSMTYNEVYEKFQDLVFVSYLATQEARRLNIPWEEADKARLAVKTFQAEALADGWKASHSYAGIIVERAI